MIRESDVKDLERKMRAAVKVNDHTLISSIVSEATTKEKELNHWFDRYIDLFDTVLNDENVHKSDPVKRLYNHKYDLYLRVIEVISTARYRITCMKPQLNFHSTSNPLY